MVSGPSVRPSVAGPRGNGCLNGVKPRLRDRGKSSIPGGVSRQRLHVLTGPTASGKSALALAWAERHDAEILSCDALLFYRGMDLGTAKPDREDRARVPHHGIDLISVRERFDVARYVDYAQKVVEEVHARGRPVLVVGGSGFYLKAFFGPVVDRVEIPEEIRKQVADIERKGGLDGLVGRLRERNPGGTGTLDLANPRRVTRALERCLATGKSVRTLRREFAAQPGPFAGYPVSLAVIERDPGELRERIIRRTAWMLEKGLVEEVKRLRKEGLEDNPQAASAIGYRETLAWLKDDGRDEDALAAEIVHSTLRLARKQRTWIRGQLREGRTVPLEGVDVDQAADLFADSVCG